MRSSYCAIRGTPGVHSFLRGSTTSIHGQLNNDNWDDAIIDGTRLRDWVGGVISNPTAVEDKTQPGTLEADIAGVLPFPCAID